ncbi:uncharacterized protein LOC118190429 [Stegodyphus dumicola]|uniref:uncharacterized protein LOC118190429 n=1 Tax=Stegodyphus dumicola TaxID=202533 RepID=UPI0015AC59BB|nr:uncharacterized protein LOC118190429 [Stegodyphus dumicola]XP_035217025.1 uncharacterized protein LOC118190429 [Stegodyphus dumicola]XP_035217026.1 uncharacterized protein LOC118190429 [Stegodyphus dumicola]
MYILSLKRQWKTILLILFNLSCIQSDMFHYYKLKKFLTAVAFARALSKRPTILPIPIPIPIPMGGQNEVVKIPTQPSKTVIAVSGSGRKKYPVGISSVISGGSFLSSLGKDYSGSSSYGYSLGGVSNENVINLSSLNGLDSNNVIRLAPGNIGSAASNNIIRLLSGGGKSPNLGNNVVVLDGHNFGNVLGSNNIFDGGSSVIQLPSGDFGASNLQFASNGLNFGGNFGDLESSFSYKIPRGIKLPLNLYSDKPRRKIPFRFRGRRMRSPDDINYSQASSQSYELFENGKKYMTQHRPQNNMAYQPSNAYRPQSNRHYQSTNSQTPQNKRPYSNKPNMDNQNKHEKKPIRVGDKYGFRSRSSALTVDEAASETWYQ